jgi:hypothetical protein
MKSWVCCLAFTFFIFIGCSNNYQGPDEFTTSMISTSDKTFTGEYIDSLAIFSIERSSGGSNQEKILESIDIEIKNDSNIGAISEVFLIDGDSIFAPKKNIKGHVKFDSIEYKTSSTIFKIGCKMKLGGNTSLVLSIDSVKIKYLTGGSSSLTSYSYYKDLENMKYDSLNSTKNSGVARIKI